MTRLGIVAAFAVSALLAEGTAGLTWTVPPGWRSVEKPMRAANYMIKPVGGDTDEGECAVYYFGQGQGGSVDANVQRWIGQFEGGGSAPVTRKSQINGMAVTTVEHSGVYLAGAPMGPKVKKSGYRLVGVIVEGPQGSVFFKLTGPAKTVAASQPALNEMLKTIRT